MIVNKIWKWEQEIESTQVEQGFQSNIFKNVLAGAQEYQEYQLILVPVFFVTSEMNTSA